MSYAFSRLRRRLALSFATVLAVGVPIDGWRPATAQSDTQVIDELSAYLNQLSTMTGTFIQVAPSGRISEGDFAIRRPGRMRFAYSPPDPTIVIADGFWAAVIDEPNDRSVDRFPLSETPLYLLLKEDVDLSAEGVISEVETSADEYRVRAEDPDGDVQGDITMIFGRNPLQLKQWIVTDPQGQTTTIVLRAAEVNGPVENEWFVIPEPENRRRGSD